MAAAPNCFSLIKRCRGIFVLLPLIIFLFPDCQAFKLPHAVNVQIQWSDSLVSRKGSYGWDYSKEFLFDLVNEHIRVAFTEEGQFNLVESKPDYIFRIDEVLASSSAQTEQYEVPCQEKQKLLSLIIFGDNTAYTTLTTHSVGLNVYATLIDVKAQKETKLEVKGVSAEYVTQKESSDSINCNPYYVAGKASEQKVLKDICQDANFSSKYQIRQWQKEQ
jgi:hypothetical protein